MASRFRVPKIIAGVLLCGALCLMAPSAASAHTPAVSATCSALNISLQFYSSSPDAPTPNSVSVVIDGGAVVSTPFGQSYSASLPLGDPTAAHTWTVFVDAVDEGFDSTLSGSSTPCAPAVPRDASAAVVVTAATCLSGETFALGAITNATWGGVASDETSYSVTATAASGHLFDDGTPTRTFSGPLAPPLEPSAPACAPAPVIVTESIDEADCDSTTVTTTTTTTTTGWMWDTATATWVATEPVTVVTAAERPASEEECLPATPRPAPEEPTPPTEPGTPAVPAQPGVPTLPEQPAQPGVPALPEAPAGPGVTLPAAPVIVSTIGAGAGGLDVGAATALPQALAHNGTDVGMPLLAAMCLLGSGLVLMRRARQRVG